MQQLTRLLRYVAPYWWQLLSSVLLMAAVGLLDAFRVLLIGPIFDRVLNPGSPSREMQLFKLPGSGHVIYLQQFVPSHFQNPWTVVAFALVAATILKGILDYAGTYLVNYAGFGMITDLRDDLYDSILRRSAAFFQRHATGTLVSTIVNDIERVQYAMSSVLAEFLQQLFTLIFTAAVVVLLGRDQINHHIFTAGTFLAFIVAVFKLYDPVRKFALFNNNFQQAMGASSEIFRFMDRDDEVREKPGAKPLRSFANHVHFENVGFFYQADAGDPRQILRDINLEVRAGEVLAVVGSSGAGKST